MSTSAEQIDTPLIKTKLSVPQLHAGLVARPLLFGQLEESSLCALILVCAPAGYGKTTLLADWIIELKKTPRPGNPTVCWLSLDAGDNEPIRFLCYLVAAFETAGIEISAEARTMLQSSSPPPVQTILAILINDLAKLTISIYFVLDDYQFISTAAVHQALSFILDHLPPNLHLVIATRSDPPIPLARLRARGQLIEIRADELRFSYDEADDFFNRMMGLGLTPKDTTRLEERTEGWIAGLQMSALALQGISRTNQLDVSSFIKNFSGSNRYILDFLVEEVLSHQPQDIQDFLLQTSILESLCGPLCDAVTGIPYWKPEGKTRSSQSILEELEHTNLFLVSLDSDRLWYRYHHLFADLLRARLEQQDSQKITELHLRASEWYEQNQRVPEAANHALDARDYKEACRLIERVAEQRMLSQSGIAMLLGWIQRLPSEIVVTRPWLCIAQAWSAMFINAVDQIEPLLKSAEQAIRAEDHQDLKRNWKGHIACLRAFVADVRNDVPGTIEMAQQALEYLRLEDAAPRTFASYMLGRAFLLCGDFPRATAILSENVHTCMEAGVTNIIAPTLSALSKIFRIEGKLHDSIALVQNGQAYIEQCDPRRVTVAGVALVGQANVLREWNDLHAAEKLIRRSLELCEAWVNPSSTCGGYTVLARILQNKGKFQAADETLHLAEESIRGRSPLPEVICDLNTARVEFWLATGQLARASQWAQALSESKHAKDDYSILQEREEITLAQVHLAEGKLEIAFETLGHLAAAAEKGGRMGHLIEILKLQALALNASGHRKQALETLQKSLALAEPEGYLRTFVDEGDPMLTMLLAYVHTSPVERAAYARKLLAAYNAPGEEVTATPQSPNLVEALTAREIEVMQLMADGLSNRQIAEKLILAEGTIKFYVHMVLEKLGTHNRTEAVGAARKLKLI